MQYCVIAYIDRNQITFYYQQKGGKVTPLEFNGEVSHPLYFYINNNDFSFGSFARQQFLNGDPNAYGNYFEAITLPKKFFHFYSNEKHVKYLLYHAVEFALNLFFNTVLYESTSIESYRTDFPLRLIFECDIQEKEKRLVEQLFTEAGFQNFATLNLDKYLFDELLEENRISSQDRIIKLQSLNGNLFAQYFFSDFNKPVHSKGFTGLGADPRLRIMAELLFVSSIAITRSVLDKESEISHLLPFAKEFLKSSSSQPRGNIYLSDGSKAFVSVRLREVNEKLAYLGFDDKLYNAIDNFSTQYNIADKNIKFVLVGDELNSEYFIDKLSNKYQHIISTKPLIMLNSLERATNSVEMNHYKITDNNSSFFVSDDAESINRLLSQIESAMKSKKELESELGSLNDELQQLQNTKTVLEKKKKELVAEINKLSTDINEIEGTKPPVRKPEIRTDEFFNTEAKKNVEQKSKPKKIERKQVDPNDFNF